MKKVLKLLFVIVLMLPILVLAESFSSEKNRANKILTKLPQTYDMYLVTGSNIPFGYRSNGTLEVVDGFNRAGFISLYE